MQAQLPPCPKPRLGLLHPRLPKETESGGEPKEGLPGNRTKPGL